MGSVCSTGALFADDKTDYAYPSAHLYIAVNRVDFWAEEVNLLFTASFLVRSIGLGMTAQQIGPCTISHQQLCKNRQVLLDGRYSMAAEWKKEKLLSILHSSLVIKNVSKRENARLQLLFCIETVWNVLFVSRFAI